MNIVHHFPDGKPIDTDETHVPEEVLEYEMKTVARKAIKLFGSRAFAEFQLSKWFLEEASHL